MTSRPMPERYLADRLRWLRVEHHYSQEEIATLTSQPRPVVSDWERGKRLPHIGILAILSQIYNDDWLRGFIASIEPLNQEDGIRRYEEEKNAQTAPSLLLP